MKTRFEEIVDVKSIGKRENPIDLNALLPKANSEGLAGSATMAERNLLLAIDMQNDFMEGGALPVTGSLGDSERLCRFIYANMDKLYRIAVSLDTHNPFQIFHPCWWIDDKGNNPAPFTTITGADLDAGKWKPAQAPIESLNYVKGLEQGGKKTLMIWPYHCLQGTWGNALENQFANMVYFHSVAKKSILQKLVKGSDPLTEMYGIIKPEYDPKNTINMDFLNQLQDYDKVFIAGEGASHCVFESLKQILDHYKAAVS